MSHATESRSARTARLAAAVRDARNETDSFRCTAAEIGITHTCLSLLLSGKTTQPHPSTLAKIEAWLEACEFHLDAAGEDDEWPDLLKNLRAAVPDDGLTLRQAAQEIGVDHSTLHKILTGETARPYPKNISRIAEWLAGERSLKALTSRDSVCVGCGCTDSRACDGGCGWVVVERGRHIGICTTCVNVLRNAIALRTCTGSQYCLIRERGDLPR